MPEEKGQSCASCYFFLHSSENSKEQIGYCRANPPTMYYEIRGTAAVPKIARYPVVLGKMWCGTYDYKG